jgi:NAD(P)-dependent dehydrogenase (short-subunit alcohol dehydrogenase family)
MELAAGRIAVVTGAASGIGLALSERFATAGMHVVMADVDESSLAAATQRVQAKGVHALGVPTDVSDEAAVRALAVATLRRFGAAHVICNNAGVGIGSDPWFGPLSAWTWVLGVDLWGVVHGIRSFLPILLDQGEGHIVNTASVAGLMPSGLPSYDAAKHGVVAISETLSATLANANSAVGVSVLCPGLVRTQIMQSERNWPTKFGEPPQVPTSDATRQWMNRAILDAPPPEVIADQVALAIAAQQFWILPPRELMERAERRWASIADERNPKLPSAPELPSAEEIASLVRGLLEDPPSEDG